MHGPMAFKAGYSGLNPPMDPKEHFYRHFEAEATGMLLCLIDPVYATGWETHIVLAALQDEIANLGDVAAIGGERQDATDHILAGISRLTNEVSDASEYAPPRDQMLYNQVC